MQRFVFLLTIYLYLFPASDGTCQTVVTGVIQSVDGKPIPAVNAEISRVGGSGLALQSPEFSISSDGSYILHFHEPGIFNIHLHGVLHRSLRIPLLIFDQEQINLDIRLLPKPGNRGDYFHEQLYTEWIRAYGNFNNFDFFSGKIFRLQDDGFVAATVPFINDTLRYQVRGIHPGPSVLPGADFYEYRGDGTYEAVIINTHSKDSLTLRYHPENDNEASSFYPEALQPGQTTLRGLISPGRSSDILWIKPLQLSQSTWTVFEEIEQTAGQKIPGKDLRKLIFQAYHPIGNPRIDESVEWIEKHLATDELHPQQRSALYIAYAGLFAQAMQFSESSELFQNPDPKDYREDANSGILNSILKEVDPRHPMWQLNTEAAVRLLQLLDYSDDVMAYTERIIRNHPDDLVVRKLVLEHVEHVAGNYDQIAQMPQYRWVIQRYGENNLARKVEEAFQKAREQRKSVKSD